MKYSAIVLSLWSSSLATAKLGAPRLGNRRLEEIPIVKVGENPPNKLARCEGDCDGDSDCDSGLKCFQRTEAFKAVPGCSGGAQDDSKYDYCVRNSDDFPVLSQVGVNPGSPLERCEGDCDSDSDCVSSDLFCFPVSEEKTFVPGCRGGQSDTSLFDYCIRRVDAPPGVAPTVPTSFPTPDPSPEPTPDTTTPAPSDEPTSNPTQAPTASIGSPSPTGEPSSSQGSSAPTPTPTPGPTHLLLQLKITQSFPLGRCEGDCDDDDDCEGGLVCFQRDANESVPGCSGGGKDNSRTDYCVRSTESPPPTNDPSPNPTPAPTLSQGTPPPTPAPTPGPTHHILPLKITQSFPLGRCEGDCDDDDDCEGGLICFQRDENESVPGCSGGGKDNSRTDYCVRSTESPPPTSKPSSAPGSPAPTPGPTHHILQLKITQSFPLGRCEGDCDDDDDCESGLVCFQRDEKESVPGCSGGSKDKSRTDYCISGSSPTPPSPTPEPTPQPTSSPDSTPTQPTRPHLKVTDSIPLSRCEGDCDHDHDCEGDLVCFQRDENESVPTCSGGSHDGSKTDYCIPKSTTPALPLKITQDFPLGLCEGDCDNDKDCEIGLICYQRNENESVRGCSGGSKDNSRTDYCIYK
eukprot:scaffold175_cov153-Cylindrotheca_fusiformis.AAC.4